MFFDNRKGNQMKLQVKNTETGQSAECVLENFKTTAKSLGIEQRAATKVQGQLKCNGFHGKSGTINFAEGVRVNWSLA
ncbi:hypothetical protein A3C19_03450 [Candidatus Kaiserbacteria bacterium RIFCSPHIGHO2_02_FULL_54_22]|uniref:Uncharacterized protein n=1 Tax=Candidatus Kaiserbacteria bacterium RIFCSPHIGHO2_02_FULL_54_22 TaxID=1798495 RepID=A0A1F6DLM3_9BACT|nr:MAG: hypothetical protein A3C19_03450 [Candidatus Kaiserbacteria bacterium RIFCSPHIGHO2_02_FULL_54_22]OGG68836.1 MAG: hypothetical protein A3E99_02860 [Candidatus Kaiserbacteria bacterium RIFCSPHIGHO2_12_FULL_54_16]OGG90146.1 MAG: hypothetical protein A3G12_03160 [Candidatus Kaiserbacteria bacterium RIFCSPLOWO2_12_FULL_54_10]